jgi:hypothetical protein
VHPAAHPAAYAAATAPAAAASCPLARDTIGHPGSETCGEAQSTTSKLCLCSYIPCALDVHVWSA